MTCSMINTEHGKMLICGSYKSLDELKQIPETKCYICGEPAAVLCDAPAGYDNTCNNPMCRDHSHNVDKDTDVCQEHFNDYEIGLAKKNRINLFWYPIQDNIYCPNCKSEEHSLNAVFCKICGAELAKRL